MLVRTNFTLFWKYSRKSNENLCKGLLTCTSFYCDRKQWVWQLFNKLASQQHGLYISFPNIILIVGFKRDDQGHAWSYFMGDLVITCTYFGRWVHLGFKTIPNLNFEISCIFSNDLKFGTRGWTVTCQMMIAPRALPIWFEIFKKKLAKTKI